MPHVQVHAIENAFTPEQKDQLIRRVREALASVEAEALAGASRLKVIARVGIGLDSVDLAACRETDITVTYTPDAPSQAVAELTVGNIINLCRHVLASDRSVREGAWNRLMGVLLREVTIGVVGVGRIGRIVCRLLQPFGPKLLACDLEPNESFGKEVGLRWVDKETIFRQADMVANICYLTSNNVENFVKAETEGGVKIRRWFDVFHSLPTVNDGKFSTLGS